MPSMSSADYLAALYGPQVFGADEPDAMWASGKTMRELGEKSGNVMTHDADGNVIVDNALYCLTDTGLHLCPERHGP